MRRNCALCLAVALAAWLAPLLILAAPLHAQESDTALVVAVDVSQSVDERRYRLQMEGIARALEDEEVISVITARGTGGILLALVTWADRMEVAIPWTRIASRAEAAGVAARVRALPLKGGEFTCLGRMLKHLAEELVPQVRDTVPRIVVDVSGDGPDNCALVESVDALRDELVAAGAVVNGLPIKGVGVPDVFEGWNRAPGMPIRPLAPPDQVKIKTLEDWYFAHVRGGAGSFVLPANGYEDFGRAIRQKFVLEISGIAPPRELPRPRAPSGTAMIR